MEKTHEQIAQDLVLAGKKLPAEELRCNTGGIPNSDAGPMRVKIGVKANYARTLEPYFRTNLVVLLDHAWSPIGFVLPALQFLAAAANARKTIELATKIATLAGGVKDRVIAHADEYGWDEGARLFVEALEQWTEPVKP